MIPKIFFLLRIFFRRVKGLIFVPIQKLRVSDSKNSINVVNDKIRLFGGDEQIDIEKYEKYFNFLEKLGLREDFYIKTVSDESEISGSFIRPVIKNKKNNKLVIFCHGVTSNRWSLFYNMHLALQRGYSVISYDARNHGVSSKSYTSLGQIESCDLQDVIDYSIRKYDPESIGLYGFSMGASTILFWISFFANGNNLRVNLAICESPFDDVNDQLETTLGKGIDYYLKNFFVGKIAERLNSSVEKLEKISLLLNIPHQLPLKLLLIHGTDDSVIGWRASYNLFKIFSKNELNKGRINLYLCDKADHGEIPFIGDNVYGSMRWMNKNKFSRFKFSEIFLKSLDKRL